MPLPRAAFNVLFWGVFQPAHSFVIMAQALTLGEEARYGAGTSGNRSAWDMRMGWVGGGLAKFSNFTHTEPPPNGRMPRIGNHAQWIEKSENHLAIGSQNSPCLVI
jgi:hypothetical protein